MELEAINQLFINKAAWAALPPRYQATLRYACAYALMEMLASYDAKNAKAIARVVAGGRAALGAAAGDHARRCAPRSRPVLDEEAAKSEQFKRVAGQLARVPRRAAPLVLDRGRPHRDVGLRADGDAYAVDRTASSSPSLAAAKAGRGAQSTSASRGCGVSTTQK